MMADEGDRRQATNLPSKQDVGKWFGTDHSDDEFSGSSGVLFEQAMAQTRMAICLTDPSLDDNPIVFANRAFRELTGYEMDEILGRNCRFLQGPDTDDQAVQTIRDAMEKEDVAVVELLNYRKDGSTFWNALHLGPIFNEDGSVRFFFGSQWDVTDVHAARADEAHARLLSRELSHRIKNLFTVISAIIRMNGRFEGTEDAAERMNRRIMALGRAHEATLQPDRIDRRAELGALIDTVMAPYAGPASPEADQINMSGDDIWIAPNMISLLGLILHELATNALKYGALSADAGKIDLRWRADDSAEEPRVRLTWTESEVALRSEPAGSTGMGMQLIDRLLKISGGMWETQWTDDGVVIDIWLPVGK